MSGIWGYSTLLNEKNWQGCLHALEEGCRIYGADGSGKAILDQAALGCHLEHFSDAYAAGDPVYQAVPHTAVLDALLFNREELLPRLALADSTSDEECLLQWILRFGPDELTTVNGDFAGAIYDQNENSWLLFRDHMGIRPLYIYLKEKHFAFATDIRALLTMPGINASVNEHQLYLRMMGANDNSAHETAFAHIFMLPAGHYARVRSGKEGFTVTQKAYFVPGAKKVRLGKRKHYEKKLYELVEDALRRRLQAVPGLVGAEMSGGLDSAVINVLIHRLGREARYFSWSPPVEEHPLQEEDERLLIGSLCRQEKIQCHFLPARTESMMDLLSRNDPPHVNTIQIGKTAAWMKKQGVRAVFSGHGGDEGASHRMDELELWHQKEYLAFAREIYAQVNGKKLPLARCALQFLRRARAGKNYVKPFLMKSEKNKDMLNPAFAHRMQDTPLPPLTFGYDPTRYVAEGGQRTRLDNAAYQAAEHGVRYLFPLMDHRVMQFSLGIPRRMFLHQGMDRYLYRQAFSTLLPENVLNQRRKDSPGIASMRPKGRMEDYRRATHALVEQLDLERWSPYWNKDTVKLIRDTAGTQDCPLDTRAINELYICLLIQRWQEEGGKHE